MSCFKPIRHECKECEMAVDILIKYLTKHGKLSESASAQWCYDDVLTCTLQLNGEVFPEYVSDTGTCEYCEYHSEYDVEVSIYVLAMVLFHRLELSPLLRGDKYDINSDKLHRTVRASQTKYYIYNGADRIALEFRDKVSAV